jgi:hypothetical protein
MNHNLELVAIGKLIERHADEFEVIKHVMRRRKGV